jgi:hypothetical protein
MFVDLFYMKPTVFTNLQQYEQATLQATRFGATSHLLCPLLSRTEGSPQSRQRDRVLSPSKGL